MAADSTFDESDEMPDEDNDSSSSPLQATPAPPRPPRPSKQRGTTLARIPLPSSASRGSDEEDERDALGAPVPSFSVDEDDAPSSPFPLTAARSFPPASSDAAPSAPFSDAAPPAVPSSDVPLSAPQFDVPLSDAPLSAPQFDVPLSDAPLPDAPLSAPQFDVLLSDTPPPVPLSDAAPPAPFSDAPERLRARAQIVDAEFAERAEPSDRGELSNRPASSDWAPVPPATPRQGAPYFADASSPPVGLDLDEQENDDRDVTIVGQVPRKLLELSSSGGGDENTRAYQAPQELIELAKRKREERLQARNAALNNPSAAPPVSAALLHPSTVVTERPPARRRKDAETGASRRVGALDQAPASDLTPPRGVPIASPRSASEGSASPVKRTQSPDERFSPLPDASAPSVAASGAPPSLGLEPNSARLNPYAATHQGFEPGSQPFSLSQPAPLAPVVVRARPRVSRFRAEHWLAMAILCVAAGFVLARWRVIVQFFVH
jgi:hypothetical protein